MLASAPGKDHEAVADTEKQSTTWKVKDPQQWAGVRLSQIEEGLAVLRNSGYLFHDAVEGCLIWAEKLLAVVLSDVSAWENSAMASSPYWTIHLCQIGFSLQKNGEGYKICSRSQEEIDEKVSCWSMSNMHKVLSGNKSKSFKDFTKGGEYLTTVPSQAARKNKFPHWATRGDAQTKHLDIRALGDETMQQRKTSTFFALWDAAGLPPVDPRIRERSLPATHLFAKSMSARARKAAQIIAPSRDGMIAAKSTGRIVHAGKRASMGIPCESGIRAGKRAAVVSITDLSDDDVDDYGIPIQRTLAGSSRNCGVESEEPVGPIGPVEVPSDDEVDKEEKKEGLLASLFSEPVANVGDAATRNSRSTPSEGEFESSDDESEAEEVDQADESEAEDDDEAEEAEEAEQSNAERSGQSNADGPREEGGTSIPTDEWFANARQLLHESMSDRDRERVDQALKDKQQQIRGERLTKGQLKNIDWLSKINIASLKEGTFKVERRACKPTFEQLMKRRTNLLEKQRRQESREKLKQAREDLQVELKKQLDEQARQRHQKKLLVSQAKEERKLARHGRRVAAANAKLNAPLKKQREKERKRKCAYQEQAAKKLEYAKRRKVDTIVRTGDTTLKIVLNRR